MQRQTMSLILHMTRKASTMGAHLLSIGAISLVGIKFVIMQRDHLVRSFRGTECRKDVKLVIYHINGICHPLDLRPPEGKLFFVLCDNIPHIAFLWVYNARNTVRKNRGHLFLVFPIFH
jgi:hypothetical protein